MNTSEIKEDLMKNVFSLLICTLIASISFGQAAIGDQNPDYIVSRARYMVAKDSLIQYQSATSQQTYKAYDYFVDKQERKDAKTAYKRQLRLERAKSGYYDYNPGYYSPYNSFGSGFSNFFYNSLPWLGLGYYWGRH